MLDLLPHDPLLQRHLGLVRRAPRGGKTGTYSSCSILTCQRVVTQSKPQSCR
jgi:hypothetical protein